MKTLVFATNNAHKLDEARRILTDYQILSLLDIGFTQDIIEDGDTLEANSAIKARTIYEFCHTDCFADDTGLEVEALHGAPGVKTARYASLGHDNAANRKKLLTKLVEVSNRSARFRTVVTLITDSYERQFEGIVNGTITAEEKGNNGFGYDPIFVPEGYDHTFAELKAEVKNSISHRARALQKMNDFLQNNLEHKQ